MKKVLIWILAAFMVFALFGCGAAKNGAGADDEQSVDIAGHYKLGFTEGDGVKEEDVIAVNEAGLDFYLDIKNDGSAVLVSKGNPTDLICDQEKMELRQGSSVIHYTYDDGTIRLEQDGVYMTFVKE